MSFLGRASEDYGRIKSAEFSQDLFCQLINGSINSPIEDLFFIAVHVQAASAYYEVNPSDFDNDFNEVKADWGVHVTSQAKIGKYRVDFLVSSPDGPQPNHVVVELDGHDFHDKDKTQRAYEKGRDRYLVKAGYRVLHYTGSEVCADPYKVAHETLSVLGGIMYSEYDPSNPMRMD